MLHTVVRWIADDVPTYVIENEKGKQKVLHHARLLLWSSAEEEEGLQMTTTQLAFQVSMLVLEPLPVGEERSRVPYTWSINGFGLNLASFQLMLDAPEPKTGPPAPAAPTEMPLKEGVGQRRENGKGDNSTPFWWGMLHPELEHTEWSPALSFQEGGKLKWDELYVLCAALPTSTRAVHLFRLSAGQCDASGLSEQNQDETNVTNYTVDLTHFSHFFFIP